MTSGLPPSRAGRGDCFDSRSVKRGTAAVDENRHVPHNRIEYQHALRGIAYLRILAGERSDRTPIGSPCWGNREIADYSPIDPDELAALRSRIEELVRKAADRLA